MSERNSVAGPIEAGLDEIHNSWGWFVALGAALRGVPSSRTFATV
ncbi:MAG: hypothetical protein ACLPTF_15250 [Steroidobacteraceae bacterium]